jgi:hypothetical protein
MLRNSSRNNHYAGRADFIDVRIVLVGLKPAVSCTYAFPLANNVTLTMDYEYVVPGATGCEKVDTFSLRCEHK